MKKELILCIGLCLSAFLASCNLVPGDQVLSETSQGGTAKALSTSTGYVDSIVDGVVTGWFYDKMLPAGGGLVTIKKGTTTITTTVANIYRSDVSAAVGVPGGKFGFSVAIPQQYVNNCIITSYGISNSAELVELKYDLKSLMHFSNKAIANQVIAGIRTRPEIVFLGDSITQLMSNLPANNYWVSPGYGTPFWNHYFANNSLNFGIGGETIEGLASRLNDNELPVGLDPKLVVLLIGTNNLKMTGQSLGSFYFYENNADYVKAQIGQVVSLLRTKCINTKLLVIQLIPRGVYTDDSYPNRLPINDYIAHLPDSNTKIFTMNADTLFMNPIVFQYQNVWFYGQIFTDRYESLPGWPTYPYHLHPNQLGYQYFLTAIRNRIHEIAPEVSLPN